MGAGAWAAGAFGTWAGDGGDVSKLPVLAAGAGRGCYAIYRHTNFVATMNAGGVLMVQPTEGGTNAGAAVALFYPLCLYKDAKETKQARPVAAYTRVAPPSEQPAKIRLEGKLADDVEFELEYAFEGNAIVVRGGTRDSSRTPFPTIFRLICTFYPSHAIPPETPQSERERILRDCVLKAKERPAGKGAKEREYRFADSVSIGTAVEWVEVRGPWGARRLRIEGDKPGPKGQLSLHNYAGKCLWEGYDLAFAVVAGKDGKTKMEPIVLKVE